MTQLELSDYQDSGCTDHTDEEALRRLYWGEGLSTTQIAERAGVCHETVRKYMKQNGIERRSPTEARRVERAKFSTNTRGYERWREWDGGEQQKVYVHRLLAVAEYGFDAVAQNEVHHRNGIQFDNRPDNIALLSKADHSRLHMNERHNS